MRDFIYRLFGVDEFFLPERLPDDDWERMFLLAEVATSIKLPELGAKHFDVTMMTYTDTVNDLFFRLDTLYSCMHSETDTPTAWRARRRSMSEVTIVDYYYDVRSGYRSPQEVLALLLQKLSVIHYEYVDKYTDPLHSYSIYMRKNFSGVVSDVLSVLETSIMIRNT
jgi:hypothetical protein